MLAELQISNFAIIDRLDLRFHERFNAFTGETGAGKSIIIDALGLVLGGRASPEMVRTGAPSARVQALFELSPPTLERVAPLLEAGGIEPEPALILTRELSAAGRSSARINGVMVPAGVLREVGGLLADITGQSEHLSLLRPSAQLDLLDQFAGVLGLRSRVADRYREASRIEGELESLVRDKQEAERRADMLRFQLEEINSVAPVSGEDEELARRRELLANSEKLSMLAEQAYEALYGESPSAVELLRQAVGSVEQLVRYDPTLQPDLGALSEAAVNAEESALVVRRYRDAVEFDPAELLTIEERLDVLNRLKRKYGATLDEVLQYSESAAAELDALEHSDERAEELAALRDAARAELAAMSAELSERRSAAAADLSRRIEAGLGDLMMSRARVDVQVRRRTGSGGYTVRLAGGTASVDATGIDEVEILLSPNPGEALKPMARIASGGETARILLAVRSVLSEADRTPTLVFDEVDVGVGGRSGSVVGEKLYGLTRSHQVLVITHLAQVAAFADAHYRISKHVGSDRTSTTVDELSEQDSRLELAAMLGGLPVTERSLQSAVEVRARAAERKVHLLPEDRAKVAAAG